MQTLQCLQMKLESSAKTRYQCSVIPQRQFAVDAANGINGGILWSYETDESIPNKWWKKTTYNEFLKR